MKLASLALLSLASCQAGQNNQIAAANPDARICNTPPPVRVLNTWGSCLHRTAYRLAGAPDSAREVAEAVVTRCADPIAAQINNAPSGEQAQLAADINRSAPGIALMYVVEARAGHCPIP